MPPPSPSPGAGTGAGGGAGFGFGAGSGARTDSPAPSLGDSDEKLDDVGTSDDGELGGELDSVADVRLVTTELEAMVPLVELVNALISRPFSLAP